MTTLTKKNIIFIPYWIPISLERQSILLDKVLDLPIMLDHLSSMDVASIAALSNQSEKYLGFSITDNDAILNHWRDPYECKVAPLLPMAEIGLMPRLFDPAGYDPKFRDPFKIVDIGAQALAVIIYPGHFCGSTMRPSQTKLIKELIRLFYAYEGYDETARRAFFVPYLDSLV